MAFKFKHFEVNCPWPSPESIEVEKQAIQCYEELVKAGRKFVRLLSSSNVYTRGYWVETGRHRIGPDEIVMREHDSKKLNP